MAQYKFNYYYYNIWLNNLCNGDEHRRLSTRLERLKEFDGWETLPFRSNIQERYSDKDTATANNRR